MFTSSRVLRNTHYSNEFLHKYLTTRLVQVTGDLSPCSEPSTRTPFQRPNMILRAHLRPWRLLPASAAQHKPNPQRNRPVPVRGVPERVRARHPRRGHLTHGGARCNRGSRRRGGHIRARLAPRPARHPKEHTEDADRDEFYFHAADGAALDRAFRAIARRVLTFRRVS